jgi:hypothetical protein
MARLRIFTENRVRLFLGSSVIRRAPFMSHSRLARRLPCELLENAIELRQRLKADRKRDFANPQI